MEPKKIISDLQEAGYTQEKIAEHVGVGQAAISKLVTEQRREMRSGNWMRLLALHSEVCGKVTAQ